MKTIKKILVPTDFSKDSQAALDEAVFLAEKINAEVYLLHSVDRIADCVADYCFDETSVEAAKVRSLDDARRKLDREIGRYGSGVSIIPDVRYGGAYDEITRAESEKGIDLLIIGPHIRRNFWQKITTHLSDRLERNPIVDTLVVHHTA